MKDNKMEKMKKDYHAIKIPENLKEKVEQSIELGKKESEKRNRKKSGILKAVWVTAGAAAAAMLAITVMANTNASVAYAMSEVPVLGSIVKAVTFRTYESKDNIMEAKVNVPQVSVEISGEGEKDKLEEAAGALNKTVEEYTDEIIANYEKNVQESQGENHEAVNTDYEVVSDTDRVFSLRINTTISMGSTGEFTKIYHIDKKSGEMITLKDLFKDGSDYKERISGNIKQQMKEKMDSDDSLVYWLDTEMTEDNFNEIREDINFYINTNGKLVLVFDKYEVAPGYMGVVEFEIPTEAITDIVKEGYLK